MRAQIKTGVLILVNSKVGVDDAETETQSRRWQVTTEEEEEEEGLKVGGGSHPCYCGRFQIRAFDIPFRVISKRSQRLLCSGPKRHAFWMRASSGGQNSRWSLGFCYWIEQIREGKWLTGGSSRYRRAQDFDLKKEKNPEIETHCLRHRLCPPTIRLPPKP